MRYAKRMIPVSFPPVEGGLLILMLILALAGHIGG